MHSTDEKTFLRDMMKAAVHFGHQVHKWNPKMRPYIYTKRNGIHIFNLHKTAQCLKRALDFVRDLASEGKTVLFVSTKLQSLPFVEAVAKNSGSPYMTHKWVAGLLTNFSTVKRRIKYMRDLESQKQSGGFEKYTKKEQLELARQIEKLENALGGVRTMDKLPHAVFVLDAVRDAIVVKEARRCRIPVIAIVDSNADPDLVDYPIPGNDDAVKSIKFFMNLVEEAMKEGSSKPKAIPAPQAAPAASAAKT